jgi:hypothetical protein
VYSVSPTGTLLQTIFFNGKDGTSPDLLLQGLIAVFKWPPEMWPIA